MNYLETGLPHTDFFPRKTDFRPPRYIPLCSLGRKYLGLEPLTRNEVKGIITRLCQPKRKVDQDDAEKSPREDLNLNQTRRFIGRKRMSSLEIEKMVDRLYGRRKTKDFEFVDNTFESKDFVQMTNRDSDDESDDTVFDRAVDNTKKQDGDDREQTLALKHDNNQEKYHRQTDELVDCGDSVKISGTYNTVRSRNAKKDISIDKLILDKGKSGQTSPLFVLKGGSFLHQQQNGSYASQASACYDTKFIFNQNSIHAPSPDHPRRIPRVIKTAELWARRTETASRQVNRIRRPFSNPPTETSQSCRVLNMKPARPGQPDYARSRSVADLPFIQNDTKHRGTHPSNCEPPNDDQFIATVASSNTPRSR